MSDFERIKSLLNFITFDDVRNLIDKVLTPNERRLIFQDLASDFSELTPKKTPLETLSRRQALDILEDEAKKPSGGIDSDIFLAIMGWKNKGVISNINNLLRLSGVTENRRCYAHKYCAFALRNLLKYASDRKLTLTALHRLTAMYLSKADEANNFKNRNFDRTIYSDVLELKRQLWEFGDRHQVERAS